MYTSVATPDMNKGLLSQLLLEYNEKLGRWGDLQTRVDLKVFCRCHFFPHQSRPKTPQTQYHIMKL